LSILATGQRLPENFVGKKKKKQNAPTPASDSGEDRLGELYAVIRRWFYDADLQAIRVTLGTLKAHYLDVGDPPWLFVVAPPGTGKTSLTIMGTARLPKVVSLGSFTPNTFLSGFYGRSDPGLLEQLGETKENGRVHTTTGNGILLAKDFTTVLSMRRETRSEILAQLREIHDGEFRRSFGTGDTKVWRGRITLVAAVTPIIDRHYSIFSTLGERFLQVRWHRPQSPAAGHRAIRQQGSEDIIRLQLRRAIKELFTTSIQSAPKMNAQASHRIANLAELVAIARTHVARDNFGRRDIEYVAEPEANTRISKGLAAIAKGVAALNGRDKVAESDLQDAFRVGLDSISDNRRRLLLSIVQGRDCGTVGLPRTIQSRELEELQALNLTVTKAGTPHLTKPVERLVRKARILVNGVRLMQ
jgi:hypothetical protein